MAEAPSPSLRIRALVGVVVLTLAVLGSAVPAHAACGLSHDDDPDGDCLSNADEVKAGTSTRDPDTDDDLLSDGYELAWGISSDPLEPNSDADRFVRALGAHFQQFVHPNNSYADRAGDAEGRARVAQDMSSSGGYYTGAVSRFYQDTLGRDPDSAGQRYWVERLIRGELTTSEVAGYFYASDEYLARSGGTIEGWVRDLYAKLLHRTADGEGVSYWSGVARAHGRASVALPFYQATETLRKRVSAIYVRFLGRSPDQGGRDYWVEILRRSGDDADLAAFLASSDEYFRRTQRLRWGWFDNVVYHAS